MGCVCERRLFVSAFDGRVHGCLDNSAYVKGVTDTISPMVRTQVELGSYITHVNDHFVVGNTFASVLQLLRQEKRPLKIRFERGLVQEDDPYCYKGEKPVLEVVEERAMTEELYSNQVTWLLNNMMIDTQRGLLVTMRVLLLEHSTSVVDNVRFLLRRRSLVPVSVNRAWTLQDTPITQYPRALILEILRKEMATLLERGQLSALFEVLNNVGVGVRSDG